MTGSETYILHIAHVAIHLVTMTVYYKSITSTIFKITSTIINAKRYRFINMVAMVLAFSSCSVVLSVADAAPDKDQSVQFLSWEQDVAYNK